MALKAELLEKPSRLTAYQRSNYQRNIKVTNSPVDRGRPAQQASKGFPRTTPKEVSIANTSSSRDGDRNANTSQTTRSNSYAKPTEDICYRCGKPGYQSNVCPMRRLATLIHDEMVEDEDVDDEYVGVEFAIEESLEKVNLVLQKLLFAPKEKGQRHNIFRSLCSINEKVCNVIL